MHLYSHLISIRLEVVVGVWKTGSREDSPENILICWRSIQSEMSPEGLWPFPVRRCLALVGSAASNKKIAAEARAAAARRILWIHGSGVGLVAWPLFGPFGSQFAPWNLGFNGRLPEAGLVNEARGVPAI